MTSGWRDRIKFQRSTPDIRILRGRNGWPRIPHTLPGGVIGNTAGFGPAIPGSSPGRVIRLPLLSSSFGKMAIDGRRFVAPRPSHQRWCYPKASRDRRATALRSARSGSWSDRSPNASSQARFAELAAGSVSEASAHDFGINFHLDRRFVRCHHPHMMTIKAPHAPAPHAE